MHTTGNYMEDKGFESLNTHVYDTRSDMGIAAAKAVESAIISLLKTQSEVRVIFAAAPSQNELLAQLCQSKKIDWRRVTAFHMDEYMELPQNAPQSFATFLKTSLFNKVAIGKVHLIDTSTSVEKEASRYGALLKNKPIDIVCLGIGENGHIAFNDPPVADFKDPQILKKVLLDKECRMQQVHDGMFLKLEDVPTSALTLTIPILMSATYLFCVVPGASKKHAVFNTLNAAISVRCPATILRTHPNCKFYFDEQSYPSST